MSLSISGKEKGKEWQRERKYVYYLERCRDPKKKKKKTLSRKLVMLSLSPVGIRKVQILLYSPAQIWVNKLLEKNGT